MIRESISMVFGSRNKNSYWYFQGTPTSVLKNIFFSGIVFLLGILLITGGILVLLLFRSFVHNLIMSEIPLRPGSQVTEAWIKPPVRPLLQLYFFNTTNPEGFLRGEKPHLLEVGPYVYEEEWEKVNVTWGEEGNNVKYQLKKIYRFRQDLSGKLQESDRLTLPNVPMFVSESES